ncbi:MAG: hypothetical protein Q8L35_04040 [Actinomycetota bacterium]|nr:hypothetical protein [Actinomycetota bacterium]
MSKARLIKPPVPSGYRRRRHHRADNPGALRYYQTGKEGLKIEAPSNLIDKLESSVYDFVKEH